MAIEAFTCLLVFKNMFSFGLTWHSYEWLVHHGIRPVFNAISSVQLVICLLTIPMCKFPVGLPISSRFEAYANPALWGSNRCVRQAKQEFLGQAQHILQDFGCNRWTATESPGLDPRQSIWRLVSIFFVPFVWITLSLHRRAVTNTQRKGEGEEHCPVSSLDRSPGGGVRWGTISPAN